MTKNRYPVRGTNYTLRQILSELTLDDSPSLNFTVLGVDGVIQTSHVTEEQMLSVPYMADTVWQYVRTTREWIPIFTYVGNGDLREVLDLELWKREEWEKDRPKFWWATPKGFPRQQ
ncbi:hypothetical protein [Ralstonia phage phiRSL1]|uniref:Uncharacterized protein n=1 Tax=Ralstonia phage phiRSL1 TaxID=1980924 RepID=B2ZXT2_9CAUD|nr:hypothetical protein RSL1_ORF062 [Ralstonia phage phiRSL1]BAG41508.1 hypothetical protein [Ralstonia phage phiRSL1]